MKKTIFLLAIFTFIAAGTFAQTFKVIANNGVTAASLNSKEVSDLFLKKKTKWSDGSIVLPVDLPASSSVREAFSKKIHGKTTSAIRNFWQQAAFSGTGTAPSEKANDNEVIEYVKKNPGAIGYVSVEANTAGVKVITIN